MQHFRHVLIAFLGLGGFATLFLMYYYSSPPLNCAPLHNSLPQHLEWNSSSANEQSKKPTMLLWTWPENYRFDLGDCKALFGIDGCLLTDDRSQYNEAESVLIYHKAINNDLSNLPPSPRPPFQQWIWFNAESPTNTQKIPGLENQFNLTLSYRQDADISVITQLTIKMCPNEDFVLPKKDKLVCWIVSNNHDSGTEVRYNYYLELKKHISVHGFGKVFGSFLKNEDYYSTIASCKFYLAFENSIHKDYITEKLNGALVAGTVPVVLGPPRQNYEDFIPGDSFIHISDFPDAKALADYLLQLDKHDEMYMKYFQWRTYFTVQPHLIQQNQQFIQAICSGCDHMAKHKEYRVVNDLYKWFFA